MNIVVKVDPQFGRAKFADKTNQIEFNTTAKSIEECKEYDASVKFAIADIFKPIDIEMLYNILDKVPDSDGKSKIVRVYCDDFWRNDFFFIFFSILF